jgi:hypothetical protein
VDIFFLRSILPNAVGDVLFVVVLESLWIAVAVLRYRLYEIDLITNRNLVYGALTASLVCLSTSAALSCSRRSSAR